MRNHNSFASQCDGKKRFTERKDAKRAAKDMTRRHRVRFNVYRCEFCEWLHVGTDAYDRSRREHEAWQRKNGAGGASPVG